MRLFAQPFIAISLLVTLLGCSTLPSSGPTGAQIVDGAAATNNQMGFKIVDLNAATITAFTGPAPSAFGGLSLGDSSANLDRIGPGDTLQISIFEVGNSLFQPPSTTPALQGGITGPQAAVSTSTLPDIQVDSSGFINVPYAGSILAAGETAGQLAGRIQSALAGSSQNPQVIVNVVGDLANTIIISGDVKQPGRIRLTPTQERLLDVIAIAGGPSFPERDTYVTLTRNGQTEGALLSTLSDDENQNVIISPGDRVHLAYQPRSFLVFGAAEKVQQLDFPTSHVTLADALALSGGPLDGQADPNEVFLFRFESPQIAHKIGLSPTGSNLPVIYHLDMMQPASYFVAQQFPMDDRDLIYIANARSNRISKFFALVGSLLSPAATTAAVVTVAR